MKLALSVFGVVIGVVAVTAGFLGFYSGPQQADNVRPARPHMAPPPTSQTAVATPTVAPTSQPQVAGAAVVTLAAANAAVAKNQAVILDVRPVAEYKKGRPKGAVNFDATLIEDGELPKIDIKKTIYIYGSDASKNQTVATILTNSGFKSVSVIAQQ